MSKVIRCLTTDATVMAMAMDATDMVAEAERIHHPSAVVTAALGRLLTASSMMGILLKGRDDSVTLKLSGNGPAGTVMAVADSEGNARGYAANPVVEIPLKTNGKLDVSGAVGTQGMLYVMRDSGGAEPYVGCTPLVSGEIAEDITQYYAVSEQTPTVCALGVLVNPDLTVQAAGGLLIQLLPFCPEAVIDQVEKNVAALEPMTVMLSKGMTPADICAKALDCLLYTSPRWTISIRWFLTRWTPASAVALPSRWGLSCVRRRKTGKFSVSPIWRRSPRRRIIIC